MTTIKVENKLQMFKNSNT